MIDVPLVLRDDAVPEPSGPRYPSFVPATELPQRVPGESLIASVPHATVTLSTRCGQAPWLEVWRSGGGATVTLTDQRVTVGARVFRGLRAHQQATKITGLHLWYDRIVDVGLWIAQGDGPSHLILTAVEDERDWRLAVGTPDLTVEGPELAEEVVVAIARRHLVHREGDEPQVTSELRACAAGVRMRPGPGRGATVRLPGVGPGNRPHPV